MKQKAFTIHGELMSPEEVLFYIRVEGRLVPITLKLIGELTEYTDFLEETVLKITKVIAADLAERSKTSAS